MSTPLSVPRRFRYLRHHGTCIKDAFSAAYGGKSLTQNPRCLRDGIATVAPQRWLKTHHRRRAETQTGDPLLFGIGFLPSQDALRYDRAGRGLSPKRASPANRKAPSRMFRPPPTLYVPVKGTPPEGAGNPGAIRPPGNLSRQSTYGARSQRVCAQAPLWLVLHPAAPTRASPRTAVGTIV